MNDLNGNMTGDGTRTFEWDAENRLVAVVKGTHRSEFGYDGFGHRVEIRELDADTNGNWVSSTDTKYVWEGAAILESRNTDGGTTLQRYYDQGFMDSDGTALYYTRDHLGSTRELVDAFGAIRARYDYDPYGRMTKISGDKDSPFLYTGHLWHPYSGLYLTLYREYDANLGRWISRDPLGEQGGSNLYEYVFENPVNADDPLGLFSSNVHFQMTYDAMRSLGFSIKDALQVAGVDVATDIGTQGADPLDSALHAMAGIDPQTGNNVSTAAAVQLWNQMLNALLDKYKKCHDLVALGIALHMIQDSFAYAHRFAPYNGSVDFNHHLTDTFPSSDIYNNAYLATINAIRNGEP